MIRITEIRLPLAAADSPDAALRAAACATLGVRQEELSAVQVFKRSFDARKPELLAVYIVDVTLAPQVDEAALLARHGKNPHVLPTPDMTWRPPVQAPADFGPAGRLRPVVVGLGPCGLLAALTLAQMGFRPLVLERGKPVRERTKDTWGLWRKNLLQPESNVQFGEGGAGLFSDGKLYSQIKDPRHLGRKVMQEFVQAGAPPEILHVAHPHVGTFKLVKVVEQLRAQILALGGEIRFQHKVTDLLIEGEGDARRVRGVVALDQASGQTHDIRCDQLVLALGHSSRDTFAMLHRRGVWMESKPFSIGVRIEHPQGVIDRARWGQHAGHPLLGAADYKLVHHASNGRAVYSFCMCPGGTVVAATSEPGRVVTNGMSQYSRNERNANAGMVVGIDPRDYPVEAASVRETLGDEFAESSRGLQAPYGREFHPLAGIVLQRQLESAAFTAGGGNYEAPGQLVGDFLARRPSTAFGSVIPSYKPGVHLTDLRGVLPAFATDAMAEALPVFGRKIRGYDMADAVMTGVETRTSSPLRITRGDDLQSLNLRGLYPAGEGAGYAGGILSAGVDGIKVAEAVALSMVSTAAAGVGA